MFTNKMTSSIHAKFTFPPGFSDRRLPSLYSDFRKIKDSNTEGYEANITTWKAVLTEAIKSGTVSHDATVLSAGSTLLEYFDSSLYGKPLALDCVLVSEITRGLSNN